MTTLQTKMLVLVDGTQNNNKFYELTLLPDGMVAKRWGRVGSRGQTQHEHGGQAAFERIVREKEKKGYQEIHVEQVGSVSDVPDLQTIARQTLVKNALSPELDELISKLIRMNRHEIIENSDGRIQVNDNGRISTPLGLVSKDSVEEAQRLLQKMPEAKGAARTSLAERYLTLVPQKTTQVRDWASAVVEPEQLVEQNTLLSQLLDSIDFYQAQAKVVQQADSQPVLAEKYRDLFCMAIDLLDPKSHEYRKITKMYEDTKRSKHHASNLNVKRIYELTNPKQAAIFEAKRKELGNVRQLWHGTRAFNILSILRKGLFIPPVSGSSIQTTGRMFGDGIYFSDQSTKSLNYSYGYWSGGRDNNCFMFLADVVMGHEFRPAYFNASSLQKAHHGVGLSGKPFHSINVRGGTCNVLNNEMIVWQAEQINLRYLVEFDR